MTPKQTALVQVAKIFSTAILAGVLVNVAFAFFSIAQIGLAFAVILMICLGKMVYDIELSKAQHLDALNKMK